MENPKGESQVNTEGAGNSPEDKNQLPKSLLDRAKDFNKKFKMIAKSTDGSTLQDAQDKITPMISEIQNRIKQIKDEGHDSDDVPTQQVLYSEYKELDVQLVRLTAKAKGIKKARTELSTAQKKFFGLTHRGLIKRRRVIVTSQGRGQLRLPPFLLMRKGIMR